MLIDCERTMLDDTDSKDDDRQLGYAEWDF